MFATQTYPKAVLGSSGSHLYPRKVLTNQGGKRPGGEKGSPLLGQCVMRRKTGTSATSDVFLKASLIFLAQNSILFCLLEHYLSIFVVSCSNLSEIRQCRMQECPAYHDQVVLRCLFQEYSTLLQSKFYIC